MIGRRIKQRGSNMPGFNIRHHSDEICGTRNATFSSSLLACSLMRLCSRQRPSFELPFALLPPLPTARR